MLPFLNYKSMKVINYNQSCISYYTDSDSIFYKELSIIFVLYKKKKINIWNVLNLLKYYKPLIFTITMSSLYFYNTVCEAT